MIIGITTVSSGTGKGHATPTGVFTILQKEVDHKSNLYNNAPMPFMQRLTWDGIAMHAGNLPGYPASHGCIRPPLAFARLLYGETARGMTVVITDDAPIPRLTPMPDALVGKSADAAATAAPPPAPNGRRRLRPPARSRSSSARADRKLVVLRNGKQIGATRVAFAEPVTLPAAYVLRAVDQQGAHWMTLNLPWDKPAPAREVTSAGARQPLHARGFPAEAARRAGAGRDRGRHPDTLRAGGTGKAITVIAQDQ